jgi:hypothetical protein
VIVVGLVKRGVVCVSAVVVLMGFVGVSPVFALSPWWHLTSGSRPTSLHSGLARGEVQEMKVSATGGEVFLIEPVSLEEYEKGAIGPGEVKFTSFLYNASYVVVQADLESIYGAGNVEVSGGPGDENGTSPYRVTFKGALIGRRLARMDTEASPGFGLVGTVRVSEAVAGRPDGQIVVTASNLGDANANGVLSPVTIMDRLPAGIRAAGIEGIAGLNPTDPVGHGLTTCSLGSVTCTFKGSLPPYDQFEVRVGVVVEEASVSPGALNEASVSGGGARGASIARPLSVGGQSASFGIEDYELAPEEEGGGLDRQAGSHPFQLTTTLTLNQTGEGNPVALAKDLHFELPPGLIGNPTPFPRCTLGQFLHGDPNPNNCSPQTAVGMAVISIHDTGGGGLGFSTLTVPLFNLEPSVGEPARFGFLLPSTPVFLDTSVRTGGDYGVTVNVNNISQTAAFLKSEVTFWGVPGDSRHDNQRGWICEADAVGFFEHPLPCNASEAHTPPPLLVLPTSCTGSPLQTSVETDSWKQQGSFQSFGSEPMPALDGCDRLPFGPSISVTPDGQAGSTPTGLTVGVHVPQDLVLNPTGLAEASVKDTTVTLPAGVVLNPAAGDGLQACTDVAEPGRPEGEIALNSPGKPSCPEASKVGTVYIKTPLLPNPLEGSAYLAAQNQNPFGSLVALYIVVEEPISGTLIKLAGEVKPDPVTGQLVSTFLNTPQLPFEDFKLHFFGGNRAPLSTPALCGAYTTSATITPWSAPWSGAAAQSSSTFNILTGPDGSACSDPLPFAPSLTAGATSIQAGGFSPFTMTMSRADGNQNLQAISLHMPAGLSGLLTGVKLCGQAQANAGTCGPESEIGETIVSVGVGGSPFSVKGGRVFITEGYGGAPFGLSIVNPAKAGPYDLEQGTACDCVVVRARIEVDPITAALTITSDNTGPYKIPTIIGGIPLQIQHVNVTITRPGFTFNPTNCNPMAITGSLSSTEGATRALSVPFQVTNCATLAFKPGFKVSTVGKTSRAKGASLTVKLTYPKASFGSQANIRSVKVDLPKQLPSRLSTLQKACPDSTFNQDPASCPAASRVGTATAITPLIPVALSGPAYFVSHGGAKFPELIVVLSGYGVTIQLHGETFIDKAGITSSTFRAIPDAPVGTFELTLPQGKNSALAANGNLCNSKLKMPTAFTAQNGATIKQNTPVTVTGCAHKKPKKKNAKRKRARR